MGIIAQRIAAAASNIRSDFLTNDDWEPGGGSTTSAGVRVTRQTALGLTTIWRCIDLLSSAVAMAPVDVTVKVGGKAFPEFTKPTWLQTPDPTNPNYDASDYFAEVAASLLIEGNFFTRVFPYVFDPQALIVVDPRRVEVLPGPVYVVKNDRGQEIERLGPMEMIHGWWLKLAGESRGISPLESLRRGIGSAIAADDFAGRFFGQGASLAFGVEVPYAMDAQKQADLRESLKAKYAGLRNSHAIGVLSDGGKFVTGLAPTPDQAQMLETRKWAVEDLCRPYGVPPSMAGSQEPGSSSYASASVWDTQFKQRAVQPLATRIERRHDRLLAVPDGIADPNASAQMRFNLDAIARADLLTRFQAYGEGVSKGVMTPNEAREKEDRAPLEGGDRLYMQQQMVPLELIGTQPAHVTQEPPK